MQENEETLGTPNRDPRPAPYQICFDVIKEDHIFAQNVAVGEPDCCPLTRVKGVARVLKEDEYIVEVYSDDLYYGGGKCDPSDLWYLEAEEISEILKALEKKLN